MAMFAQSFELYSNSQLNYWTLQNDKEEKKQQISLKTENHSILRIRNELNWIILLWGWMNKRFLECMVYMN